MKILYYGSACDEEWFVEASKIKKMPSYVAQYKFEMALLNGFSEIDDIDMETHYLYQENYYPTGHFLKFKSKIKKINQRYKVKYISYINLPLLKEIDFFLKGLLITLKWAVKNRKNKEKIIFTPFNYTPLSLGVWLAAKLARIKRANVFTDLSSDIINKERQANMIFLKRLILPMYLKLVETVEKNFDIYILFTESMKKIVNVKNKPYLVMEGIFNNEFDLAPSTKNKAIMHAGTLSHEYGVGNIIEAFLKIQDDNLELWLFGDGNMREAIEVASSVDSRIHYFGFKPQKEVFEYEKKAMLLINVRNPRDLYTKYSFPSKTFEYMVSGTPFLTTKLEGIPSEYYNYIYTIESNEVDLVKEKILGVLGKSQRELDEFGENARNYVLNNKNTNMQLAKVVKLLKNNM